MSNWNQTTINGKQYLVIEVAQLRIPLNWDPSSNVFIAVAAPTGGLLDYPALVKGDPGIAATFSPVVNYTELAATDPTPASASLSTLAPGLYQLNFTSHAGATGVAGGTVLHSATDLAGTALAGSSIVLNAGLNGFVYQVPKLGDRFLPASIASTPPGNPTFTLCTVPMGPFGFDWRPTVEGQTIVVPNGGTDVIVDLYARLNGVGGNIVGSCFGLGGVTERLQFSSAPPAGSLDAYDRVPAGQAATIFMRVERRSGSNTFTTSNVTTSFKVTAQACP